MGMMFKNGIPYAGIPDEIDAATVGGHTVEADVPVDAAFTDTINSDVTVEGNPVILKDLQGGVPFSEIAVKGENISGQEMTLTATGKNQLPITVTSGTGAGVTYTVDNDEITVSGATTGVSTITVSAPNMTITQEMRLSYRGNLSGMTPKATVLRNGETVYPTPNDTIGSKLLAGDVLQNVYIQQQSADVAVSGSAKFQLEYGTEVTEYEKYSSETYTFTPDSVDYVIPTDITQKEDINVLTIDAEGATLSVTGVKENKAIEKLWNLIPSTVKIKTGDFVTNSNGYIEPVDLFNVGNGIVDIVRCDNYLFATTNMQPMLYVIDLTTNTVKQIQCQNGDNSGFKKIAVCKSTITGGYTVFLTSVNNKVFFGSVDMNSSSLYFMSDVANSIIVIPYGKNALSLTAQGRLMINNSAGDIINFNQELSSINLDMNLTNISDVQILGNGTVAVKGTDSSTNIETYHIYDMTDGARRFFQDVTDENMTYTIDTIVAVGFYRDNLIIYSDQGMFYTIPKGSFYNPLSTIETTEDEHTINVRSYVISTNPMGTSTTDSMINTVGDYLILVGNAESAIYSPDIEPKMIMSGSDICKVSNGGNGIYFITSNHCRMIEYETEEVNLAEAFMRL